MRERFRCEKALSCGDDAFSKVWCKNKKSFGLIISRGKD